MTIALTYHPLRSLRLKNNNKLKVHGMKTKKYDIYYYDANNPSTPLPVGNTDHQTEWGPELNLEYPDLTSSTPFILFKLVVNGSTLPPEFIPNNQGGLAVQSINRDSMMSDSTQLVQQNTIKDKDSTNNDYIKLYPNPNNGIFTLQLPASFTLGAVIVSDISGREVYAMKLEAKTSNLHLHLPKGLYYLKFMNESIVQTLQFVVQ